MFQMFLTLLFSLAIVMTISLKSCNTNTGSYDLDLSGSDQRTRLASTFFAVDATTSRLE
jgi:hypothetical protein